MAVLDRGILGGGRNAVPPGLRGELTRWLAEIGTGVFVGRASALVRDRLWAACVAKADGGTVRMVWRAATDQGFDVRVLNLRGRCGEDVDGRWLVRRP